MTIASFERLEAACFMVGSTLLAVYAVLLAVLIPVRGAGADYSLVVLHPSWARLSLLAFIAVLFMLTGLDAVFSRIRATAGLTGTIGFFFTKITFVLQACVLTWELLLIPSLRQMQGLRFFSASALSLMIREWRSSAGGYCQHSPLDDIVRSRGLPFEGVPEQRACSDHSRGSCLCDRPE